MSSHPPQIFVITPSGASLPLELEPSHDVAAVKEGVCELAGISLDQQRLLFNGVALDDARTLSDYKIAKESVLHVQLRLRGGSGQTPQYICGDCGAMNEIKPKDPIRCRRCGYRIMYKMRTKNRARRAPPCTRRCAPRPALCPPRAGLRSPRSSPRLVRQSFNSRRGDEACDGRCDREGMCVYI